MKNDTKACDTHFKQTTTPITADNTTAHGKTGSTQDRKYYAHSLKGEPVEKWQPLEDHLKATAKMASEFATAFNSADWGNIVGLLHDLGKYSDAFQQYLLQANGMNGHIESRSKVDHSTAGAQMVTNKLKDAGKLLAYIIAGHHSGLSDGDKLRERLSKNIPSISLVDKLSELDLPPLPFELDKSRFTFQLFILTKMLFSALTDADFLDTEKFMNGEKARYRGEYADINSLEDIFSERMNALTSTAKATEVNKIRAGVLGDCLKAAQLTKGFFSLTVPTGGGKTLSSMAFALRHSAMYQFDRIIYTIPFTSIIEQNADVFRKYLGDNAVLEHHSNFEPDEEDYRSRLAGENWEAPVIVTTNVQFYESFFANRTSRCRKLHNVANSIIILDEVQSIPVKYLLACIELLRELVTDYRCSIVLCSATQPAIQYRDEFKSGIKNVREIIQNPKTLSNSLKRAKSEYIGKKNNSEIADSLLNQNKVLCIVNTRRDAKDIFTLIGKDTSYNYHLSALMCPIHRSEVLAEIKERLKEGNCRVVSTQLVEAGVDIDFPVVYRALAGIDSIAQATGRCNREGLLEMGYTYVFMPENGIPKGEFTLNAQEAQSVIRQFDDMLSLNAIEEYFRNIYWIRADELDKEGIIRDIKEAAKGDFAFKTVADKFKLIKNDMMPVVVPYNKDAVDIIRKLDHVDKPAVFTRRLQKYTVQLYSQQWAKLVHSGALEIKAGIFPVLVREDIYDKKLGLIPESPDEYEPQNLMI